MEIKTDEKEWKEKESSMLHLLLELYRHIYKNDDDDDDDEQVWNEICCVIVIANNLFHVDT